MKKKDGRIGREDIKGGTENTLVVNFTFQRKMDTCQEFLRFSKVQVTKYRGRRNIRCEPP